MPALPSGCSDGDFIQSSNGDFAHSLALFAAPKRIGLRSNIRAVGRAGKDTLGYVIRRFNASSVGLKKPEGLDLRWDRRFTRPPDPTGA
jgi:hypothetical protein